MSINWVTNLGKLNLEIQKICNGFFMQRNFLQKFPKFPTQQNRLKILIKNHVLAVSKYSSHYSNLNARLFMDKIASVKHVILFRGKNFNFNFIFNFFVAFYFFLVEKLREQLMQLNLFLWRNINCWIKRSVVGHSLGLWWRVHQEISEFNLSQNSIERNSTVKEDENIRLA